MKRLFLIALAAVTLQGASCSGDGSILQLTQQDQATLASGQAIAVGVPWVLGTVGGRNISSYVVAGANVNATTIAAALAAINGTAPPTPLGSLLLNSKAIPGVTIKTP
jgi:hypothetical protein